MNINDPDVDFKIHDGYVAFSTEIVRLALLSPTAFAIFIALAGKDATIATFRKLIEPGQGWLMVSLISMAFAILFALAHRYVAIDFMYALVKAKREGRSLKGNWRGWSSDWAIILAPLCLLIGAITLFLAFFTILGGTQ